MTSNLVELLTPRILVVDDERQIHASLRLRLGREYDLVFCFDANEALEQLQQNRFDLCFVDIHMPRMDGICFIDAARKVDPQLGYVVLSAFDSDENLRRTIPLQVYDFISKPLPERAGFEARIPDWISDTRTRRNKQVLAAQVGTIASDLNLARLEREVEIVASESARDALLKTASLLTTIHAHLVSATSLVGARLKNEPGAAHLSRNLAEARKIADGAVAAVEGYFDSAYGSRDSAPAFIHEGLRDAIAIAVRTCDSEAANKAVDLSPFDGRVSVRGLSGITFLMMMVPAIGAGILSTAPNTTIGVSCEFCARLDEVAKNARYRDFLWMNRRNLLGSQPGTLLMLTVNAPALTRNQIESWMKGDYLPLAPVSARGLLSGIEKCHGLLGFSTAPRADQFRLLLALPT